MLVSEDKIIYSLTDIPVPTAGFSKGVYFRLGDLTPNKVGGKFFHWKWYDGSEHQSYIFYRWFSAMKTGWMVDNDV